MRFSLFGCGLLLCGVLTSHTAAQEAGSKERIASLGLSRTDWSATLTGSNPTVYNDTVNAFALDIWFGKDGNRFYTFDLDWAIDADIHIPDQPDGTDTTAFSTGLDIAYQSQESIDWKPFVKVGLRYTSFSVEGDLFNDTGVNACDEGANSLCVDLADADELAPIWSIGFDTEKLRISYEKVAGSDIETDGFKVAYVSKF